MKKKHFNIPIFIPELACPFQCIYCNQCTISGVQRMPTDEEIISTIKQYVQTMPKESEIQLAYFGGNFTGIPLEQQAHYLNLIAPFINKGQVKGIRISTRPDYINEEVLTLLKKNKVEAIELGAQSLDDQVLKKSKRGHTASDTVAASRLIKDFDFSLGLQMMIGLPGDHYEKSIYTAKRIVELGAENTRIYPTLVIKGTILEKMYRENKYQPLELDEAVRWSKDLLRIFDDAGVSVLKLGLHPSEGILSGEELLAGPFHQSFRELVETQEWNEQLSFLKLKTGVNIELIVPRNQFNFAIGYRGKNKRMLEESFTKVKFIPSDKLSGKNFEFHIG